jgi:hypothetical protein
MKLVYVFEEEIELRKNNRQEGERKSSRITKRRFTGGRRGTHVECCQDSLGRPSDWSSMTVNTLGCLEAVA